MRKDFRKQRGVIACGHPLTAEAGALMLREGGNAVDAAVAAAFASCVVESILTGLWGGGFALVHMAQPQRDLLFDFFVNMPGLGKKKIDPRKLDFKSIIADFKGAKQEFHIGKGSVGVPGCILGLWTIHQKFGRLPFRNTLVPAIHFAKKGFPFTKNQSAIAEIVEPILLATPYSRKIYAPKGRLLKIGERLCLPDLARTLETLGEEGPDTFYRGEVAKKMVDSFKEGGLLTEKDLDRYRVILRKPLTVRYRGEAILMNPPPSSGGSLIAYSLKLLSRHSLRSLSFSSAEFLKLLIRVMQQTNAMREKKEKQRRYALGNTTHISVMDEEGNAVSLTTSHGSGAGFGIPGIGLPFNNILGEQDLNPLGFHKTTPGERFRSMMSPSMAIRKGKPHIVLGSGGSNRLRTAILQALIKIIDFKIPIRRAVEGPRIHWEGGELSVEPGFSERVLRELLTLDSEVTFFPSKNIFFGGVHATLRHPTRNFPWDGAGDPRRGGVVKTVR